MSPRNKVHTIIISDVHLGSIISRADALVKLLSSTEFDRLILLGDFFDSAHFKRLNQSHWKLLSHIRALSDPASGKEIIWVRGNHDKETATTMAHMVGARVVDEYAWEQNGKRFLSLHGDKFAAAFAFNDFIDRMGQHIFYFLQFFDKRSRHIVKLFDRAHTHILRLPKRVAAGAIGYAKERDAQYVFCGHTHRPMYKEHIDGGKSVHYYNTGCWTQSPSHFATISDAGEISLLSFE